MNYSGYLSIKNNISQIEKLFDEIIHSPWSEKKFRPHVDLYETEDAYIFEADCPGMTIEDIHLTVKGDTLEISGERSFKTMSQYSNLHIQERTYGRFYRKIRLPDDVERENIQASMNLGELKVILKKKKV